MSDFRINSLQDYNGVLDYKTYVVTDNTTLKSYSAKSLNVSSFSNSDSFNYLYNGYLNDLVYYDSLAKTLYGKLFKINDNNINVKFNKTTVGNHTQYTPVASSYSLSSNSQESYGDYFTITKDNEDNNIEFNIEPNIYSKEKFNKLIEDSEFNVVSGNKCLQVTTSENVNGFDKVYGIVNSALYTNKTYSFNAFSYTFGDMSKSTFVFGKLYGNNHGGKEGNLFTINEYDYKSYFYDPNVLSINSCPVMSQYKNTLALTKSSTNVNTQMYIPTNGTLICDKADVNCMPRFNCSFIVTNNFSSNNYSNGDSIVEVGDWNNKTLLMSDDNQFEFNVSSNWSFYINDGYFYVGSLEHKMGNDYGYIRPVISFGEGLNTPFTDFSFVISFLDYETEHGADRDLFWIKSNEGVYFRGRNISKKYFDKYETSSYWDLVIHKDELDSNIYYTY